MGIVTNNLSFTYGKKAALNNVNLSLTSGFNVLLGPNGAGKSTLFSLLTGLRQTAHGTIKINEKELHQNKSKIMSQMGVVFQQSTLDLDLSVKQNLFYYASLYGIAPKNALQNLELILQQLNLPESLDDKITT